MHGFQVELEVLKIHIVFEWIQHIVIVLDLHVNKSTVLYNRRPSDFMHGNNCQLFLYTYFTNNYSYNMLTRCRNNNFIIGSIIYV